jgi:serine/threonine-protein kinase RsbW
MGTEPSGEDRSAEDAFALALPPEPEQVRTARLFAAALARHFGADEERIEDLKIAISEAATNSIKAHRVASVGEPVRILASADAGLLRFRVVDAGRGFDVDLPGQGAATPPGGLFEGSLGLTLIRALFPEVEIGRNRDGGMTVTISLELEPAPSGS